VGRGGARACVGYVRVTPCSFVCKESEISGKRLPPRTGRTLASLGGGRETTHRNAELQDRLQAPASHRADGETITRDANIEPKRRVNSSPIKKPCLHYRRSLQFCSSTTTKLEYYVCLLQ